MKSRVAFVVPNFIGGKHFLQQPLGFIHCYTLLLKNGFPPPLLIDNRVDNASLPNLVKKLKEYDKIFITTTTDDIVNNYSIDYRLLYAFHTIREIKNNVRGTVYVCGAHGTVDPISVLKATQCDGVIIGEYENTIIDLAETESPTAVSNVYLNINNAFVKTNDDALKRCVSFDEFETPNYEILDSSKYFSIQFHNGQSKKLYSWGVLQSSRGCPYECNFCLNFWGRKYRLRSADKVIEDLRTCQIKYKIENIFFIDSIFGLNLLWLETLASLYTQNKLSIKTHVQVRADQITSKFLSLIKQINCQSAWIGVETLSSKELKLLKKEVTGDVVKHSIQSLQSNGINVGAFIMIGYNGQDEKKLSETISTLKAMKVRINPILFSPRPYYYSNAIINSVGKEEFWKENYEARKDIGKLNQKSLLFTIKELRNDMTTNRFNNQDQLPQKRNQRFINKVNPTIPFVTFPLTNRCTMKCSYCGIGGESTASTIPEPKAESIMEWMLALRNLKIEKFRFTGGEPFLYKDLPHLLKFASDLDVYLLVNTNASLIHNNISALYEIKENVQFAASLDTLNPETWRKIINSKVDISKVVENIKFLAETGHLLRINTVVSKQNIDDIDEIIDFCTENNINIKLLDVVSVPTPYSSRNNLYVDMAILEEKIKRVAEEKITHNYSQNFGVPMSIYRVGDIFVEVRNSQQGTHFDLKGICKKCPHFPCQEGLYDIFVLPDGNVWPCRWFSDQRGKTVAESVKYLIERYQHSEIHQGRNADMEPKIWEEVDGQITEKHIRN